jgi:hypothetical protein
MKASGSFSEGDPREPLHIHVRKAEGEAKFWLRPDVVLADSIGFDAPTLRNLLATVEDDRNLIERAWHEYFG